MQCPGQNRRYWKPEAVFEVKCPGCGSGVEFFKDDTTRKCPQCGHRFLNPHMDFGCAAYCAYAEQCIGNLPPELIAQRQDLLKNRVAIQMKRYHGKDFKRIGHTMRLARYAEQIGKEEQGNLAAILSAAYLHDIGDVRAEQNRKNPEGKGREDEEATKIVRTLLAGAGAKEQLIEEVCTIIGQYRHPGKQASVDIKTVHDASLIARLEEEQKKNPSKPDKPAHTGEQTLLMDSSRRLAKRVLLGAREN